jgi:hypothetical protein
MWEYKIETLKMIICTSLRERVLVVVGMDF